MNHENNGADEQLRSIVEADLSRLLSVLDRDVKQRARVRDSLKRLLRAWKLGDTNYASKYVNGPQGKTLIETYGDAAMSLDRLRLALARNEDSIREELDGLLAHYCAQERLRLQGRSGSYHIGSVLEITLDVKKRGVKVGTQYVQSLHWDKIKSAIDAEQRRLWKRGDDANTIRGRLAVAYQDAISKHPNVTGWVRLEDIYQELKKNVERSTPNWKSHQRLIAYYRDEFTVDLSILLSAQMAGQIAGTEIEFSAIRDPRLSFQVPLPDGTANSIGFMRPKRS